MDRTDVVYFPIALILSDSSMRNLQSASIIAAFPIAVVIVPITFSFICDEKNI